MCVLAMTFWGSWQNTQVLAGRKWRFELFYWDYAMGILLMLLATDMRGLLIFGMVFGAGIGLFLTSNWALANGLAPGEEAGKYLGLTNLATAGSGALARLEGPALDWLNAAYPSAWIGYKVLFVFGAVCILLSVLLLRKIEMKS